MQTDRVPPSRAVVAGIAAIQLLALAVWAGGLLALGAVVAPIVFRVVPAPTSADAMTLVFRRFDVVAIVCAAVALVAEAAFAVRGGKVTRADLARGLCLVGAAALAITIGTWLSPGISELHRGGAIRGRRRRRARPRAPPPPRGGPREGRNRALAREFRPRCRQSLAFAALTR